MQQSQVHLFSLDFGWLHAPWSPATKRHVQGLFWQPHRRGCLCARDDQKLQNYRGIVSSISSISATSQAPATNKESFELDACDLEVSFPLLFSLAHCLFNANRVIWQVHLKIARPRGLLPKRTMSPKYLGKSLHLPSPRNNMEQLNTIDNMANGMIEILAAIDNRIYIWQACFVATKSDNSVQKWCLTSFHL